MVIIIDYKCRIYQISGISNVRDIGGYNTKDGRAVSKGRFIRSTALSGIGSGGIAELRAIGVECVIDLRSTRERENMPDDVENIVGISYIHVPMLDYISSSFAEGDFTNFPKSLHELYISLLDNAKNDFNRIFNAFADERFKSYLFHCTAGKDRTGVTAMLLLDLSGVGDEDIVEDYSYTQHLLSYTQMGAPPPGIPGYVFESAPETMRITLDYLKREYGGAAEYLSQIGVDNEMQNKIIDKLFSEK